jgi:predicted acetyltransferase
MTTAIPLDYHTATADDLPLLAYFNEQLIVDEGGERYATRGALKRRMAGWLADGVHSAFVFSINGAPVAYALLRDDGATTLIHHFFVRREARRRGVGRGAMALLLTQIIPPERPVRVDVLVTNEAGRAFWAAMGFTPLALRLIRHPGA